MIAEWWWRRIFGSAVPADSWGEERLVVQAPSSIDSVRFQVAVWLSWHRPRQGDDNVGRQVRRTLLPEIRQLAARTRPTDAEVLQDELNHLLAAGLRLDDDGLLLTSAVATVSIGPADSAFVEAYAKQERELVLDRLRRQHEIEQLRHLRDQILSDPGMARAYWMQRHPTKLDVLVNDTFDQLTRRVTDTRHPSDTTDAVNVLVEFLNGLDEVDRETLVRYAGQMFLTFGREDLGRRLCPDLAASSNGGQPT